MITKVNPKQKETNPWRVIGWIILWFIIIIGFFWAIAILSALIGIF